MIAVIFEVTPNEGKSEHYFELAASCKLLRKGGSLGPPFFRCKCPGWVTSRL